MYNSLIRAYLIENLMDTCLENHTNHPYPKHLSRDPTIQPKSVPALLWVTTHTRNRQNKALRMAYMAF